jgi:hypothetical protein
LERYRVAGQVVLRVIRWENGSIVALLPLRGVPCVSWEFEDLWRRKLMKWLKKALPSLNGKGARKEAACPWLAERCPALHELMTITMDEGKPRVTTTISLFTEGTAWKCRVQDRQTENVLFLTGESFLGVLDALEGVLQSGAGDWREDKWARDRKKTK